MSAHRHRRTCAPFRHDYEKRRVTVPFLWDLNSKGILKTCRRCGKQKAL